jgi:uncharacterized protein
MPESTKHYLPQGLPIPRAQGDGLDKEFWDATRRHELLVQKCNRCGAFQWGPEWICHKCHSFEMGWQRVSGRGSIHSWTRSWNPVHPALREAVPYIVVVVQLADADNIRMVGNLLGDQKQNPSIDADVEAVFEDHPNATLVQWRLSK